MHAVARAHTKRSKIWEMERCMVRLCVCIFRMQTACYGSQQSPTSSASASRRASTVMPCTHCSTPLTRDQTVSAVKQLKSNPACLSGRIYDKDSSRLSLASSHSAEHSSALSCLRDEIAFNACAQAERNVNKQRFPTPETTSHALPFLTSARCSAAVCTSSYIPCIKYDMHTSYASRMASDMTVCSSGKASSQA